MMFNNKKGFSLVELLIVLGISAILMAMSAPKYQGMVEKAQDLEQRSYVREALNYVDVHNLECPVDERISDTVSLPNVSFQGEEEEVYRKLMGKLVAPYNTATIGVLREAVETGVRPSLPEEGTP